jgi:tRNA G18 (ribose-2'-O)-methylase SpoU
LDDSRIIFIAMHKLSHSEIAKKRRSANELTDSERIPVVVLVDSIRSLYNVGSIFRTSDGAQIEKLILTGFTPSPPRKEIEKTALGATKSVPWDFIKDPLEAIIALKTTGYRICLLELTDTSTPYYEVRRSDFPICLVIGNEITGVSKNIIQVSDMAIEIPMFGMKQSLNVAVAYGIAIFELRRICQHAI